jgi:hypothetical protein
MKLSIWVAGATAAALAAGLLVGGTSQAQAPKGAAVFTADGKLEFPKDYRTWVFLSSGMDMSYSAEAQAAAAGNHVFDNVFVDRVAYAHFEKTGAWPEGTVFVLEIRRGSGQGSINRGGQIQTGRLATEIHVKDKRFKSGWAFYNFRGEGPGIEFPQNSACNQCHEANAAVDTTFVQFYPTLLPVATERKTLSPAYIAAEKVAV